MTKKHNISNFAPTLNQKP